MAMLTNLAMRILIGEEDRTGPTFKKASDGIQSNSDELQRVQNFAKSLLDIRLFAYSPIRLFAYSPIRLFAYSPAGRRMRSGCP